tara:strand:+ start:316 stop:507 length:192 start_codon:yes stop_codon:yes gene_type:complete
MRLTRGRAKQKIEIKKLDIPKVITEDLGYYMQFGFKRIPSPDNGRYHTIKHAKKPYAIFNAYE